MACRLALSPSILGIRKVFHISNLHKYVYDLKHVIRYETLQIKENITFAKEPMRTQERGERRLRNKTISYLKVIWKHKMGKETWEP